MDIDAKLFWLIIFMFVYWSICIFWGVRGAVTSNSPVSYFLASRRVSFWIFLATITVASFSAWTFIGYPGLLYSEGFQFGFAAFYAIVVPFTGLMFFKRQWLLAKRYGFISPTEMFSHYFQSNAIKYVIILVAIIFTVPYVAVQLRASGFLLSHLTDNALPTNMGIWLLAIFLFVYVALGGMRALFQIGTIQALLFLFAMIALGAIVLNLIGGFEIFRQAIAVLSENDTKRTSEGFSHYLTLTEISSDSNSASFTNSSEWAGLSLLSFMLAFLGIQSSPTFSMLSFSSRDPRPFAVHQVWASSLLMGIILVSFTIFLAMGAHFLGADAEFLSTQPDLVNNELGLALQANGVDDLMDARGGYYAVVPYLINLVAEYAPWLGGFLGLGGISVMQATSAAFLFTTGGMIARSLHAGPSTSSSTSFWQINGARFYILVLLAASTVLSMASLEFLIHLGSLALATGFMMWPSLIAISYVPWFTRYGIILGLLSGITAVAMTESAGIMLIANLGVEVPWGYWPFSLHSAFWGILFNLLVAILVSAITQNRNRFNHRMQFHHFLRQHCSIPVENRKVVPVGWSIALTWFFFAFGPGAVLGTTIFGNPNNASTWIFGIPSIWTWQILWIIIGIFMMWFLAYRVQLRNIQSKDLEALADDISDHNINQVMA